MSSEHALEFRVRHDEADQMGVVHHSRYLTWFDLGRLELLRAAGLTDAPPTAPRLALSLQSVEVRFLAPAREGDWLRLVTTVIEAGGARIVFKCRLSRGDPAPLVVIAEATIAAEARDAAGGARPLSATELALLNGEGLE